MSFTFTGTTCTLAPIGWPSTDGSADTRSADSRSAVGRLSADGRPFAQYFIAITKNFAEHHIRHGEETKHFLAWNESISLRNNDILVEPMYRAIKISRYLRSVNLFISLPVLDGTMNIVMPMTARIQFYREHVPSDCLKWVLHKNDSPAYNCL